MWEAVILAQFAIYPKTRAGIAATYNTVGGKAIKTISGISPEDCQKKVQEFLNETNFTNLYSKEGGVV